MKSCSRFCMILSYSIDSKLIWINTGDTRIRSQHSCDLCTWPGAGKEMLRHHFAPFIGRKFIIGWALGIGKTFAFVLSSV